MKYSYILCSVLLVLSILINVSGWLPEATAQNVDFPDTNLAAAVRDALNLNATDPITQTALAGLTQFAAGDYGIENLTGLEYATSLIDLYLADNQISDLSPLSGLTSLNSIDLVANQISDLSSLSGLTNLTELGLEDNQISDLSPLSGLTSLTSLRLHKNSISDLSPLSGLTSLTNLHLEENSISDLSPLSGLTSLTNLHLGENSISDLSPLSGLTNLIGLHLEGNQISDLSSLSGLTVLRQLDLGNNQISDISSLSGLTNLTILYLGNNQISDISPLSGLTNLRQLDLGNNQISDISPLSGLTRLTTFTIDEAFDENNPGLISQILPSVTNLTLSLTASTLSPVGPDIDHPITGTSTVVVKQPKSRGFPSDVNQDRVIFHEIRNAEEDKNDWIELKNISDAPISLKDWEVSIVIPSAVKLVNKAEDAGKDEDIVTFPDYTLPAGGVLLILNTDPSETQLKSGQDITDPERNLDMPPQYLIAPEMRLPDTPYLLILRSATDKNGKPKAFEDIAGNYFRDSIYYRTQIWPLRDTLRPLDGTEALLTQGQAWRRSNVKARGYVQAAWTVSGYQSGIGYDPDVSPETNLGTPGYPNDTVANTELVGRITVSEVMFATNGGLFSESQWIELYNNTSHAAMPLNLSGWKLAIEARDSEISYRYSVIEFDELYIAPNQTVLLITRNRKHSTPLAADQIYDLFHHHTDVMKLGLRENNVLGWQGFGLRLYAPDGTLVDVAGNLDGERGRDTPKWVLPSPRTEDGARTSLIRQYQERLPLDGTEATHWVRAVDIALPVNSYYGHITDIGTPGYKAGGPVPVTLSDFSANRTEFGVSVEWTTASELNNAGFNIFRSQTKAGAFLRVNATLIPGAGTTAEQNTYIWKDTTAESNVAYYYRIEDVSLDGTRELSVTVRMKGHVSANGKSLQKWGDLKRQK